MTYMAFRRGTAAAGGFVIAAATALATAGFVTAGGAMAQPTVMKIGHPIAKNTGLQLWAELVKAGVEKRAPGRIDVQIYPASQLGAIPRMVEGAQLGTIEMIEVPPEFLSGVDPRFSVVAAPGIFDDIAHGDRTMHDPEFKAAFWHVGETKGVKLVGLTCDAPSDYATVKPVRTLADFHGPKLRVFGSPLEIETLRRLGATGVPMPLSEVLPAVQQRAIDGNKSGMPVFVPFKYESVAKYVLRPRESVICVGKFVSTAWFAKLPADLRAIIAEESAIADEKLLPWAMNELERLYKAWVAVGGEIADLSPAEQAELRRRLSTVGDDILKDKPEVLEVYRIMKAVAERTRKTG
jgi:TRAP-type C4-dicarboxylate transport system substrate-binding protein